MKRLSRTARIRSVDQTSSAFNRLEMWDWTTSWCPATSSRWTCGADLKRIEKAIGNVGSPSCGLVWRSSGSCSLIDYSHEELTPEDLRAHPSGFARVRMQPELTNQTWLVFVRMSTRTSPARTYDEMGGMALRDLK
jgi:hypothetical protein